MASLMKMCSMMVILLSGSIGVVILPGQAIGVPAPAPVSYQFLKDCGDSLGDCGIEVYLAVFKNWNVSVKCCTALVETGQECHDDLVQNILLEPDFKGNVTEVLAKRDQVWSGCAVSAPTPSF